VIGGKMREITEKMKQVGVITYGNGINVRSFAQSAEKKGYLVLFCDGFAKLYKA
jgi:hypothetical protein